MNKKGIKNINPLLQWWVTPVLPKEHIHSPFVKESGGLKNVLRIYFRKLVVHPIKRRLSRYYLILLRKICNLKVIGITGSAGKTTTKEMLASILSLEGNTVASFANIDPVYNIPTTILKCSPKTRFLVLEMGVEYIGEMDFYLWLTTPDIGIITNIYPTHTQFFGDVGGVFREKVKLVKRLDKNGVAILNKQNKFLKNLEGKLDTKIIWFGNGTEVMSSLEKITKKYETEFLLIFGQDEEKRVRIRLPLPGFQFIDNALAASAAAFYLGISLYKIKKGLEIYTPAEHRMKAIRHSSGAIILDDSYNNNPMAAKEAIRTFFQVGEGKNKVLVFGDMLELGNWDYKYHKELGEYLSKFSMLDKLICVGKSAAITAKFASNSLGKRRVVSVSDWHEAVHYLQEYLRKNYIILVKGSRSIGLDQLVSQLI